MQQRRGIGIVAILIIALIAGRFFKNVEVGLIIGLAIGLVSGSLIRNSKKSDDDIKSILAFKFLKMKQQNKLPIFSTWRRWYFFVIIFLLLLIIFFAWFTKYFA